MHPTARRERYRQVLSGTESIWVPGVFNAVSARIAEEVGFQVALLPGSAAAATLLATPDLVLLTLSELATLARQIVRATSLSVMVDADHGYGNALGVMRTVQELEAAGVSALTLEDAVLPQPFAPASPGALISIAEMQGKLRAALEAREDPSLVIIGRTNALRSQGLPEAIKRAKAYEETGVDALLVVGLKKPEEFQALREAVSLPLLSGAVSSPPGQPMDLAFFQKLGYRMILVPHLAIRVATRAVYETLQHLRQEGNPEALAAQMIPTPLLDQILRKSYYTELGERFLR
ncbi:MAG: oxaloacetate decarboxylase [Nitrospinota bacterium]|nr:MAG: oxaloacetate decarboxylase [Nitrospinota bacterium]